MSKFLKRIVFFLLPLLAAAALVVVIFGIEIPNLSNSISFNAKMQFLKDKGFDNSVEILAVGSSMSLNNIHSESIAKASNSSYMNTASWGQSIVDDYKLIKIFAPLYKPKTIIITSNFMDFENEWSKIKFDLIDAYLAKDFTLTGFDLRYNIKNAETLEEFRNNKTLYDYLNYDDNGGINLDARNLKIDSTRWKGRSVGNTPLDFNQYNHLDSISNYCKTNDISLVFVQSPFREGYYSKLEKYQIDSLASHTESVTSILNKNDHRFINTLNAVWPDSLFADYSHLNEKGAKKFTEYFLERIKEEY